MNSSHITGGDQPTLRTTGDFWIGDSGDDLTLRPSLKGNEAVDVAIVGGGFSGLWTAYFLLVNEPQIRVAIVERNFCGYGASGRNGGWCSPRFPVDAKALMRKFGKDTAREVIRAQIDIVDEISQICEKTGIDAQYRRTGLLSLARNESQLRTLKNVQAVYRSLGLDEGNRLLSAEETFARVHVSRVVGGLAAPQGAALHPGRLVRGLARAVEDLGAVIYEASEAVAIHSGQEASVETEAGVLRADRAVVVATEAYRAAFPGCKRTVVPMSSSIILTAPLTEAQWAEIGWEGGECLSSEVHTKNYLTRTADNRILYGSRGAPYLFGSRLCEKALNSEANFDEMRATFRDWWPNLEDVEFTHQWGGYLGVPRDWMPSVSYNADTRIAELFGYTGRGVSTSALCAKLLASLITSRKCGLEGLPFHRSEVPKWEIEPLRWLGVRYVQNAFARMDNAESAGSPMPIDSKLAIYLGGQ